MKRQQRLRKEGRDKLKTMSLITTIVISIIGIMNGFLDFVEKLIDIVQKLI